MSEPMVGKDVERVIGNELRLLTPAVRRSAEQVEKLLHPDFVEFGSSGRRWDRRAMVAAIGNELTDSEAPDVAEMRGLSDAVVLVTYLTDRTGRRARRSSLWRKADDGTWLLYFHQGTPLPT
ncbi:nuclear transport factor 2 family protein [Actinoalloteichus hymeniacidonis]|nr:nuclear transport factor 2 family protein [Actinoalloteichus hymeniacidonis]MBB5906283.1 hypothetical protein [Actinoalloteichus hymeniacidonis]